MKNKASTMKPEGLKKDRNAWPRKPEEKSMWRATAELFPPLAFAPELDAVHKAILEAWPLGGKHLRSLPGDIRELSHLLTCERGQLKTPYWQRPAFVSAYLYYFLPWNLLRLGRLFAGLALPEPPEAPLLLDIGSGPLTLPLALWLARPKWRALPIRVLALDSARQPLALGGKIFTALARRLAASPWQILPVTGPPENLSRYLPKDAKPWLLTAANLLNELRPRQQSHCLPGMDDAEEPAQDAWQERLEGLLLAWAPLLAQAPLLAVEPGTRLGGNLIMRLRKAALEFGLTPLAPCTHAGGCPLLGGNSWCHFVFGAADAPEWLKALARAARLHKTALSLAMLLMGPTAGAKAGATRVFPLRVVSQSFEARGEICRYGCAKPGLCLMPAARNLVSGSLTNARLAQPEALDAKSGAKVVASA